MRCCVLLILIVIEIVYLVVGGVIFWALQNAPEAESETTTQSNTVNVTLFLEIVDDYLGKNSCVNKTELVTLVQLATNISSNSVTSTASDWDIGGSVFFAMTIVSTIGYGKLYPTRPGSRAFFCCYALVGIPLTLVMMSGLGEKINYVAELIGQKLFGKCSPKEKKCKVIRTLVIFVFGFICFLLIPAAVFATTQEWSYGIAVYYGVVTLTTIGFGDYVPGFPCPKCETPGLAAFYRVSVGIWIYFGLAWLSGLISSIQDSFKEAFEGINARSIVDKCRRRRRLKVTTKATDEGENTSGVGKTAKSTNDDVKEDASTTKGGQSSFTVDEKKDIN